MCAIWHVYFTHLPLQEGIILKKEEDAFIVKEILAEDLLRKGKDMTVYERLLAIRLILEETSMDFYFCGDKIYDDEAKLDRILRKLLVAVSVARRLVLDTVKGDEAKRWQAIDRAMSERIFDPDSDRKLSTLDVYAGELLIKLSLICDSFKNHYNGAALTDKDEIDKYISDTILLCDYISYVIHDEYGGKLYK